MWAGRRPSWAGGRGRGCEAPCGGARWGALQSLGFSFCKMGYRRPPSLPERTALPPPRKEAHKLCRKAGLALARVGLGGDELTRDVGGSGRGHVPGLP